MPIRIVHTADNHVDLPYLRYPDEARVALQDERLHALRRVVDGANARRAHVLVIAGDLFDGTGPKVGIIRDVVAILRAFEGERALVIPGNHDHCGQKDGRLWPKFREEAEGSRVVVLDRPQVHGFEVDDQHIEFFPCPCEAKTSPTHAIGWVKGALKRTGSIHVGIAHGNVEGLGLDSDDRYFNMTERDLAEAGVHTWLLGHIHRPAPAESGTGSGTFFIAGSTTPESVRRCHEGSAWSIDVSPKGVERFERFRTGTLTFSRIERTFGEGDGGEAVEKLRREIMALDRGKTVLDVVVDGELAGKDLESVSGLASETRGMGFIDARFNQDALSERLSPQSIAKLYPEGTNASRLLNHLLTSAHPTDAATALAAMRELA